MIGKNVPDRSVAPERDALGPVKIKRYSGQITIDDDWFISNSLPYAMRAAFDPYNGRRGGGDWYTRIENNLVKDASRIFQRELNKVK